MHSKTASSIIASVLLLPTLSFAQSSGSTVTRASVRAELEQLEHAGFRPDAANINYPSELRAAERRIRQAGQNDRVALPLNESSAR